MRTYVFCTLCIMWDIQNYASSSLYSCIFIILYGEIISIILKDAYTIQKHITFPRTKPRGFGIFESPSGHVSHLRAQFITKEPCCSTLPQYTRLRLIIKVARPNPFPNIMEVILKCRSSMNLELKLLSMQQIWDFKVPSTELTFSMEHGPSCECILDWKNGISSQPYLITRSRGRLFMIWSGRLSCQYCTPGINSLVLRFFQRILGCNIMHRNIRIMIRNWDIRIQNIYPPNSFNHLYVYIKQFNNIKHISSTPFTNLNITFRLTITWYQHKKNNHGNRTPRSKSAQLESPNISLTHSVASAARYKSTWSTAPVKTSLVTKGLGWSWIMPKGSILQQHMDRCPFPTSKCVEYLWMFHRDTKIKSFQQL